MPKVKVKVPHRSGFDKSHQHLLTAKCGTLVPILCDELIPNTRVHLKQVISASLPPLATDTFMRCDLKVEAFFVPTRLLYGGFTSWLTKESYYNPDDADYTSGAGIPILRCSGSNPEVALFTGANTLAEYLGIRFRNGTSAASLSGLKFNIFPFLAYHRVYDDWYRNSLVQSPVFNKMLADGVYSASPSNMPFVVLSTSRNFAITDGFDDGVRIGDLRQRNFGYDYFTCALPNPQLGDAQKVTFQVLMDEGGVSGTGSFSIAALRAANSLQQFSERNQMAGLRYQDYLRANYGADLSSGVAQRTLLLGSGTIPVYSKGVYSNSNYTVDDASGDYAGKNPFAASVGAEYGVAKCVGDLNLVDEFVASECGYLMVIASLVPKVSYSSGIDRMMLRYNSEDSQTDMANPILQNVGNQPIYMSELNAGSQESGVFGYADRYADFKYLNDRISGLLRDGRSMDAFVAQRDVVGTPTISSQFLQIPQNYLDQVAAVNDYISQYGVWIDCYSDYKVSMPLAEYSIPSLQDPAYEHGEDVDIEVGGNKL